VAVAKMRTMSSPVWPGRGDRWENGEYKLLHPELVEGVRPQGHVPSHRWNKCAIIPGKASYDLWIIGQVAQPEALITTEEGTILFDTAKCTGCGLCFFACPFGVIGFNWSGKVTCKCKLCSGRLTEGKPPACVITCLTQALSYGEYEAFTQEAKRTAVLSMVSAMSPRATQEVLTCFAASSVAPPSPQGG
jgi:NAD-dependent dihydropyrimidine dehydrogenase PreA subunit